jgi:hypothetical protein
MSAPPHTRKVPDQPPADGNKRSLAADSGSVLFRAVNEQIHLLTEGFAAEEELELLCECDRRNCFARLSVAPADYEAVRRFPTRFLITPEHVGAEDRIVEETSGFLVVEKVGAAAQAAILRDPRRQTAHQPTR